MDRDAGGAGSAGARRPERGVAMRCDSIDAAIRLAVAALRGYVGRFLIRLAKQVLPQ